MQNLTPREIVIELDRYIVGQQDAKRAMAIAIRNRWRRQQLTGEMRKEVSPKNILMIGPTGVGKTEIARRLARLSNAPFIKVEASKYTEVGYYGRDVESMVRELVENAITIVREVLQKEIEKEAKRSVEKKLLEILAPMPNSFDVSANSPEDPARFERTREKMRAMLVAGEMENRMIEIPIEQKTQTMVIPGMSMGPGGGEGDMDLQGLFDKIMPKNMTLREVSVSEARKILFEQECESLINPETVNTKAIELAENQGMIFIDEIDKVVSGEGGRGADVSRQGVQRDLLPIVEGTLIQTRYGQVDTNHVLFIAAGAFHKVKPSDLMPELQGRFPIRVELDDLTKENFVQILTEPQCSITRQYAALMDTEGVKLVYKQDAIEKLAEYAFEVNQSTQNIGARRLHTIMERLLEELSFEAPDMKMGTVEVNAAYVTDRLDAISQNEDLSRYIL